MNCLIDGREQDQNLVVIRLQVTTCHNQTPRNHRMGWPQAAQVPCHRQPDMGKRLCNAVEALGQSAARRHASASRSRSRSRSREEAREASPEEAPVTAPNRPRKNLEIFADKAVLLGL